MAPYLAAMKQFYHCCSKGLKNDLLFADAIELAAGINRIAVSYLYCLSLGMSIRIVAFCLLNNHFHFVLYGEEDEVAAFMDHYKLLTLKWIQIHRGERLHGDIELGRWKAESRDRARDKVIYTLRQTLETGMQVTPQGYPWCSARFMFCDNASLLKNSIDISEYGIRSARRDFHTGRPFPKEWKVILPEKLIWPGNYTDLGLAQNLFSGVKDFMFCLNNGNIDRSVNAEIMTESPSIPDTEVKDRADSLAKGLFGRKGVGACSADERLTIARYLRKEMRCGYKQLARVVKMLEEDLRKTI